MGEQWRAVGQRDAHLLQVDRGLRGRLAGHARPFPRRLTLHLTVELGQAVHGRAPLREGGVVGDEPGQRGVDLPEGVRELGQGAKRERAREVARRGDQQRKEIGKLADEGLEHQVLAVAQDQALDVVVQGLETAERNATFLRLAAIERDALGLLAQPYQTEAEVGLDTALHVVQADQRVADQVGEC